MHDPSTVAFEIKYPWWTHRPWPKGVERWEDVTPAQQRRRSPYSRRGYRNTFITVWHEDPERDGTDDSCGWFPRSRHGDQKVLKRIVSRFEFDWDRTWDSGRPDGNGYDTDAPPSGGHVYMTGYFRPDGQPHYSPVAITVNLFHAAAGIVFSKDDGFNWRAAGRFMRQHLHEIIRFAENPTDSLHDSFTRKFAIGCGEPYSPRHRQERLEATASIIYGWILRASRPWWRHPKWHVHHWRLQVHPLQQFKRWAFSRCASCGKGFRWGETVTTNSWNGTGPRWFRGERDVHHSACAHRHVVAPPRPGRRGRRRQAMSFEVFS